MGEHKAYFEARNAIGRQTDAEIAFGEYLEQSGVDCDAFMIQWRINHHKFNSISHYLYGLSDDVSMLPRELAAMLTATRRRPLRTAAKAGA